MSRRLPDTASIATPGRGSRLSAPSADRNRAPLCDLLARVAPLKGRALELASGTGQHVIAFAAGLPGLHWQPTEPDPARRASIDAYRADAGLDNLASALELDATAPGWGADLAGQNLIVLINLLHLISMPEAEILIDQAARALTPGGRFVVYGPFMRNGKLTSEGDAAFHASLTAADPNIGYKDSSAIVNRAAAAGLSLVEIVEMPANNLALVLEKTTI